MIMLIRTMDLSGASQVLSLIGHKRPTARPLPDGPRADLAAVSPVAHTITSVPLPMPARTSGSRRLAPLGAAVRALDSSVPTAITNRGAAVALTDERTCLCDASNAGDGGSANASVQHPNADPEWTNESNAHDLPCWVSTDSFGRVSTWTEPRSMEQSAGCIGGRRSPLTLNYSAMPTISCIPTPGSMPVINDKGTKPMQADSRAQEIALATKAMKRQLIRIVSRDGMIDDEEMEVIQAFNTIEHDLQEKAEDELFAIAMVRRGRNSQRVVRIGRQMFGDEGPSAA